MLIENLQTLKINKMTKDQYTRNLLSGNIEEDALYLTPQEDVDFSDYAKKKEVDAKVKEQIESHDNLNSSHNDIRKLIDDLALRPFGITDINNVWLRNNPNTKYLHDLPTGIFRIDSRTALGVFSDLPLQDDTMLVSAGIFLLVLGGLNSPDDSDSYGNYKCCLYFDIENGRLYYGYTDQGGIENDNEYYYKWSVIVR